MSSETNGPGPQVFQPLAQMHTNTQPAETQPAEDVVLSPCRRECCLDDDDVCLGCGRLLSEIREWKAADSARRREICAVAQGRVKPSPFRQS